MYLVASLMGRLVTAMNWLTEAVNSGEKFCRLDGLEDLFTFDCDMRGVRFNEYAWPKCDEKGHEYCVPWTKIEIYGRTTV